MTTYSIVVRLQRVTVEEAYVRVPVTQAVCNPPDTDGQGTLNGAAVLAEAVKIGASHPEWSPESRNIEVHPIQKAPPDVDGVEVRP